MRKILKHLQIDLRQVKKKPPLALSVCSESVKYISYFEGWL